MDDSDDAGRFTAEEMAVWGGFLTVFGRMDRAIEASLQAECGISHVEFEILMRLAWQQDGRLRLQDLARDSVLTRSGMSRAVGRLESLGFLVRSAADTDRRGVYASLTPMGRERFRRAMAGHVALVRTRFLGSLTTEDRVFLAALWQRIKAQLPPDGGDGPRKGED